MSVHAHENYLIIVVWLEELAIKIVTNDARAGVPGVEGVVPRPLFDERVDGDLSLHAFNDNLPELILATVTWLELHLQTGIGICCVGDKGICPYTEM